MYDKTEFDTGSLKAVINEYLTHNHFKSQVCKDTYLVERFYIEQRDKGCEAICKCKDNNLESKINSDEKHVLETSISTLPNSATLTKQTESIEWDEVQLKTKRQIQPKFSKNLNISKHDTSVYSLLQLSGRKIPPASNPNCNPFKLSKEFETKNSTNVKNYVLQFVDSNYSYSNNQKNESDFDINQTTSNDETEVICYDNTQLSELNNSNQAHLSINTSTTAPSNMPDTSQLKYDISNSYSNASSPNDYNSDMTIENYRNKDFKLNEVFGKTYSPYSIPLLRNIDKSIKEKYKKNSYKPRVSADTNISR
ncbi:hypothetical protein CONCODRAFT_17138 [Conidiobolus coronatus NRRL 28638]|uniref:Uncharacterized protein n=1 Tax=Conidiobolus coronatus (strain ATCC 28846 / CBS 209.66 / NRRL 28638) TaxID=796925 RepID=A0A137P7Y7_CONC2|nr:hypothetical protein CONCODRAFT_17138 [Conidiobolus coronatus NRRL 28638]|eukprot:KXN71089.1 hypothetical protein CONCODRAFT_17138 [Conidiobolus coronatus NRRL 28638]